MRFFLIIFFGSICFLYDKTLIKESFFRVYHILDYMTTFMQLISSLFAKYTDNLLFLVNILTMIVYRANILVQAMPQILAGRQIQCVNAGFNLSSFERFTDFQI